MFIFYLSLKTDGILVKDWYLREYRLFTKMVKTIVHEMYGRYIVVDVNGHARVSRMFKCKFSKSIIHKTFLGGGYPWSTEYLSMWQLPRCTKNSLGDSYHYIQSSFPGNGSHDVQRTFLGASYHDIHSTFLRYTHLYIFVDIPQVDYFSLWFVCHLFNSVLYITDKSN